jgi:uncharacterized surface protein with fasciclin (FAS1) repeats
LKKGKRNYIEKIFERFDRRFGKLNGKEVATLQGGKVKIDTTDGVEVNSASVVTADVMASNGVIHIIDTVLIPAN